MFVAPPEVHQNIIEFTGDGHNRELSGLDVMAWSLEQSCLNIERYQPLRVMQGLEHHQREKVAQQLFKKLPDDGEVSEEDLRLGEAKAFREREDQNLEELYAPAALKTRMIPGIIQSSLQDTSPIVQSLLGAWRELDKSALEGASMHEEHEREVAHEVEQEIQIERPPKANDFPPCVDKKLRTYIQSGDFQVFIKFDLAFDGVGRTSSAAPLITNAESIWNHLRVTEGFIKAVEHPMSGFYDNYLRPVNWALASKSDIGVNGLLLLSQYEVNKFLHEIRHETSKVTLYVYEPRVAKSMSAVDSHTTENHSLSVQSWLTLDPKIRLELHLFAGQLYLATLNQYRQLCETLDTAPDSTTNIPLSFVKEWIGIRRKGQNYLQSHIGQIVSGRVLKEEVFVEE